MKATVQAHGEVGRFIYWFNLLSQRIYNGGVLEPFQNEKVTKTKIGKYAYTQDGFWVELPALAVDYRNGYQPNGSKAFSALGYDFYLFRGLNYPEAKQPKQQGTFRVNNTAEYLAQQVAVAWAKLGGKAKLEKDYNALVCIGKGDVWVSLYG
jgi:hypothetical protein